MCTVLLPPGVNLIAVKDIYIYIYVIFHLLWTGRGSSVRSVAFIGVWIVIGLPWLHFIEDRTLSFVLSRCVQCLSEVRLFCDPTINCLYVSLSFSR
jgi:hypothetical protein